LFGTHQATRFVALYKHAIPRNKDLNVLINHTTPEAQQI
jgi:hypothetical protein